MGLFSQSRPSHLLSTIAVLLVCFLFIAFPSVFPLSLHRYVQLRVSNMNKGPLSGLTFLTMIFNRSFDEEFVEHNCMVISSSIQHRYIIYTDNATRSYCDVCECKQLQFSNCECPQPDRNDCRLCEKLVFIKDKVKEYGEYVYLDSDLLIVKHGFMDWLQTRTKDFDFLAGYGFDKHLGSKYRGQFNSGLFFIRHLKHVDYGMLDDIMWEIRSNNDQNSLSYFVHSYIQRWDSLSLKWHCRFLHKIDYGIPPQDCFTMHGRGPAIHQLLDQANVTLLTIPKQNKS